MKAKYDKIGLGYATNRKSDPRIAKQLYSKLRGATRILNIGAGTGSYEPNDVELVAVEPSAEMITQRKWGAHPVVQASAEKLPFEDNSFSHAMTILSMHHWIDRQKAFKEINRVTREKFVSITWNPEAGPFWLTRDYFPEIYEKDKEIFPNLSEIKEFFDEVKVSPLLIPEDCRDGFLAAYWKRPEAYLNPKVRKSISTFAKMKDCNRGLMELREDIANRSWMESNRDMLPKDSLDVGYIIVEGRVRSTV